MKNIFIKVVHSVPFTFRRMYWSRKMGSVENDLCIHKNVTFKNPKCLFFGNTVGIGKDACFLPVVKYCGINYNPKIIFGDNCWIGNYNSFASIDRIQVGNNVLFAGNVHVTDHSHGYSDLNTPIAKQSLISKGPVIIEDNCWLGFSCEILSGVHLGEHTIVAARAVVTKSFPSHVILAGNPARIVKKFDFELKEWVKV